jgi:NOL1/NOP2/fmu family ribosome biogenesis protein
MVVDAPCSGSGLFRKDPGAVAEWSEASVETCSFRQRRILSDVIEVLKQDGYLIYSTCSYSRLENEDICDWIIERFSLEPLKIFIDPSWGIVETTSEKQQVPGYRFYPDKLRGEGFFIACFQQTNYVNQHFNYSNKQWRTAKQVKAIAEPFLKSTEDYILSDQKEIVIASLKKWEEEIATTGKVLNLRKSGIAVGTIKGKDLIPHHELALTHLVSPSVSVTELDKDKALQYLRRQDFTASIHKKGWAICKYEDINLGWIKVLPNRVNNYYPTNWRILKS